MPQLPDLIHLAIPAFIGLLVLEAVLDAIHHSINGIAAGLQTTG